MQGRYAREVRGTTGVPVLISFPIPVGCDNIYQRRWKAYFRLTESFNFRLSKYVLPLGAPRRRNATAAVLTQGVLTWSVRPYILNQPYAQQVVRTSQDMHQKRPCLFDGLSIDIPQPTQQTILVRKDLLFRIRHLAEDALQPKPLCLYSFFYRIMQYCCSSFDDEKKKLLKQ